jgi:hypothetical protein
MRANWRVIALAGRADAIRLCRSSLVLASLALAALLVWLDSRALVPQWWVWDVQLGSILLVVAGAALVAAHLAAGRVHRDGAGGLYASFPAGGGTRVTAHLASLAAPVAGAAVLAVVAAVWLDLLGAVGSPRPGVLVQALALVALGGAAGVAVASYLPHPIWGVLALIVLAVPEIGLLEPGSLSAELPLGAGWLFPWNQPVILHWLPGPTPLIPPAAHLAWLAAFIVLAAVIALARSGGLARPAVPLALAGSLVLAGWSGWQQTRQVQPSAEAALISRVTHPASAQSCVRRERVKYCAYPGYGPDVARWAAEVNGVLARVPSAPASRLLVRQIDTDFTRPAATRAAPADPYQLPAPGNLSLDDALQDRGLQRFNTALAGFISAENADARLVPGSSRPPVYVGLAWGAGSAAGAYQLGLAVQTAWWATHLPTTWWRTGTFGCSQGCSQFEVSCLPVGQAREAIALWLAAAATPATKTAFDAVAGGDGTAVRVRHGWVLAHVGLPAAGYQPGVQYTAQGLLLAREMLTLPPQRVERVLRSRWPGWLSPRAADAQLASALHLSLPPPPPPFFHTPGEPANPTCR